MLHSSFWHHAATELPLSACLTSSPALDHDHATSASEDTDRTRPATKTCDGPLLEFLYPEKTLAFIRRFSMYSVDTADSRRRTLMGTGMRQFSTTQWRSSEGDALDELDELEAVQAKQEMQELLLNSTADEALRRLLWANDAGKQELVWQLYSNLAQPSPSPDFLCNTLDYLGEVDFTRTANRVLQIFDRIPAQHRRASSYRIATTAYVALKMVGPAIQLLEEAFERFDPTRVGIDAVLKRTIQDDQWDLSLRVFKMFLRCADRRGKPVEQWRGYGETYSRNWGPIFGQARHVLEPKEHLKHFFDHVDQFRHELNSTDFDKRALRLFANGYVPCVMLEVLDTPEPDEKYIYEFFTNLFRDLAVRDFPTWTLYEFAIPTFIYMPRYQAYTNQPKVFLDLYSAWRQEHLDGHCKPPSKRVINALIRQHARHESYNRVDAMVDDLRMFHPNDPWTPDILRFLIIFYAKGGLSEKVQELFHIFRKRSDFRVDLKILTSLVYASARRNDVLSAIQQFRRITDEFNLIPDTACWNALLYSFTRADDLDGALECFNNCLESGVKPNLYTFGPMLDLCANRGDIEAFEALFSRAKQLDVPVETDRRARSGYVQVFLNSGDPEGAEQIALGILHSWRAGTFAGEEITHVWNLLITHYAVARRLTDSRRLYDQMVANKIPLNTWTYGALMRAMVEAKNTNAAYKVLRVTMPSKNIRVHAYHYALVISGFLDERQPQRAKSAYNRMRAMGIQRTPSLRQQELRFTGTQDLLKLQEENNEDPRARLENLEKTLRQSLMSDYGHEIANDEPTLNRYLDSPEISNIPQGYFSLVIMLYSARGAYDIAKELLEQASKLQSNEEKFTAPITLLTALIEVHAQAEEHEEVDRCWNLAYVEASRLVKTFSQVMHPEPPTPESDSIIDPQIRERFEQSRIATNRRQILFRATRAYIRALLLQDTPQASQKAQRTIHNLLSNGFIIDNLTWNEFIQYLATSGRVVDAFTACEMYLMPNFPGWANLSPVYVRKYREGYAWMELRHYDMGRKSILPRYKTLVVLAATQAKVRRDEQDGLGYNPDLGGWVRELLEQLAPKTVKAIETMPRTGDDLQMRYLGDA